MLQFVNVDWFEKQAAFIRNNSYRLKDIPQNSKSRLLSCYTNLNLHNKNEDVAYVINLLIEELLSQPFDSN